MGAGIAEKVESESMFRDPSTLTYEQLTDPDYRLKELEKVDGKYKFNIACSKCHHCR